MSSELTDWTPDESVINQVSLSNEINDLIDQRTVLQHQLNVSIRTQGLAEQCHANVKAELSQVRSALAKQQQKVDTTLDSVKLILRAIVTGNSSHWQKKENLRLAIEILEALDFTPCLYDSDY
jgi:hypothetical protein